eukprot:EG_transcript_12848
MRRPPLGISVLLGAVFLSYAAFLVLIHQTERPDDPRHLAPQTPFAVAPEEPPAEGQLPSPAPSPLVVQRPIKVLVTKYPHLSPSWLHPARFPCHVPCQLYQPKSFKGDKGEILRGVDIYQVYGNDGDHIEFYDVMQNPFNFTLMITNYNNFESPHVAKEAYRWIAKLYHKPRLWEHFHIVNSHQQGSIVPFQTWTHILAIPGVERWVTHFHTPDLKKKRADAVAVLIASHQGHTFNRVEIAVNLSRLVPIHVYGKVASRVRALNPAILSPKRDDCPPSTWYDPVITPCLLRPYPFTLAFENSIADDYASEKVYNPLLVGSVPIYAGAPNIDNLVPPQSIIKYTDFATVEDLVYYMKCLLANPQLYEHYTRWRSRTSPSWDRIRSSPHPLCAACELIARDAPVLRNVSARFPRAMPTLPENVGSQ